MIKLLPPSKCFLPTVILHIFVAILDGTSAQYQYLVEILESTPLGGRRPVIKCEATGANFGDDVMAFSFGSFSTGCALRTIPEDACEHVTLPQLNHTRLCDNYFAVVPRGNCSFSEKAYNAQMAQSIGYQALIVYNNPGQPPIPMSGSKYSERVTIPVVMVTYACMQNMMGNYSVDKGFVVSIKATPGYYDLIKYLIPFVAVVSFCLIVLLISLIIRVCRERRRLARKRLSRSNLKKIPTKKYKKGAEFEYETCAICLEDFQDGEKVRILPCRHAYHCKCIDPWLTKNRKVCPVCKRKVGPSSADSSDSDNERRPSVSTRRSNLDNEPLLRYEQPMATTSSADFGLPGTSTNSAFPGNVRAEAYLNLSRVGRVSDGSISVVDSTAGSMEHLLQRGTQVDSEHETNRWPLTRASKIFSRAFNYMKRATGADQNRHQILDEESLNGSHDGRLDEAESGRRVRFAGADNSNYDNPTADGHSMTTVCSNQMTITADVEPGTPSAVEGSVVPSPPIISNSKPITQQPVKKRRHHASYSRSASIGPHDEDDDIVPSSGESNGKKRKHQKRSHRASSHVESPKTRENGKDENLSADDEESGDASTSIVQIPPPVPTPLSTSPPPEDPMPECPSI
uniref:RING-type E3 ubiquitin transferase n=1 Tax=Acrobeloides nanus TaxID=290746 RepID=A0A914DZD7_9BILA